MANRDKAHGLIPRYHPSGTIRLESMALAAANSAIGIGSVLTVDSDGAVNLWSSGAAVGVAAEAKAASTGGTILVYSDPEIIYSAQTDDGTGTTTAATCINLNSTVINNASVSNGMSQGEVDESASRTGNATDLLRIVGLYAAVDNAYGEFNELLVKINNHSRASGTGTIGV